jgi:hypothetical protein
MTITFCFLKANREDDVHTGAEKSNLTLKVAHPKTNTNILLSPTLRLLGIMVRRGILASFTTIDELLDVNGPMNIIVKPEHLDEPVFVASIPGGRGLDSNRRPMTTNALGDGFKRRSLMAGYRENSSFYSWRRELGTVVDRSTTRDTVRAVLGHDPGGRTFETSYDNRNFDVDVMAIALGEEQQTSIGETDREVLYRMDYNVTPEVEKAFLDTIVANDPGFQKAGTNARQRKAAAKSARRRGRAAMRAQLRTAQNSSITLGQFRRRVEALKEPGRLFSEIRSRAAQRHNGDNDENDEATDEDGEDVDLYQDIGERVGVCFDDDIDNTVATVTTAADTTDSAAGSAAMSAEVQVDDGKDVDDVTDDNISYGLHVSCFLDWLLTPQPANKPTARPGNSVPSRLTCALCEADSTVPVSQHQKIWLSQSRLLKHQLSTYHSDANKWVRQMNINHPDGQFKCPYSGCPNADHIWPNTRELKRHILGVSRSFANDEHARNIRYAGWSEEEFWGDKAPAEYKERMESYRQTARDKDKKRAASVALVGGAELKFLKILREVEKNAIVLVGPNPPPDLLNPDGSSYQSWLNQARNDPSVKFTKNEDWCSELV